MLFNASQLDSRFGKQDSLWSDVAKVFHWFVEMTHLGHGIVQQRRRYLVKELAHDYKRNYVWRIFSIYLNRRWRWLRGYFREEQNPWGDSMMNLICMT